MRIHPNNTAPDERALTPPPFLPEGFTPEGVPAHLIHETQRLLVRSAFSPKINIELFLACLLRYATLHPRTTMQYSLFRSTGESQDIATILIASEAALANSPDWHWGAETTHKIILVLEALQIIKRVFHRTYTEIRLFLGEREISLPDILQSLQQLHDQKKNRKVKQIAKKAIRLLQTGEFAPTSSVIPADLAPVAEVLVGLLREHQVTVPRVPSLAKACQLIATAMHTRRVSAQTGDSVLSLESGRFATGDSTGDSVVPAGESPAGVSRRGGALHTCSLPQTGDSLVAESPVWSVPSSATRPNAGEKGDSATAFPKESPVLGDSADPSAYSGELVPSVSYSDHTSLDVITLPKVGTLNDTASTNSPAYKDPRLHEEIRHESADLAERYDGSRTSRWLPRLIVCVQRFAPAVRRLAEIDTLYHSAFPDFRGKPKIPGGWFVKRCEEYAVPGCKVKNEIRQWDESRMAIAAIHRELQKGYPIPSAALLPLADAVEHDEVAVPGSDFRDRSVAVDDAQHSLLNTRMDEHQARALCAQIRQEGKAFNIQADVYLGDHQGEYVVGTVWGDIEEEWKNAAEWNRYFVKAKACF